MYQVIWFHPDGPRVQPATTNLRDVLTTVKNLRSMGYTATFRPTR